jgi:hypothetical protein
VPITPYLTNGDRFDAETRRVMGVAFEATIAALRLADRSDPIVGMIAQRIIELARAGETNPDLICETTLSALGIQQLHSAAGQAFPPHRILP